MESSNHHYFQEDIYNDIQRSELTFPTVEFNGYTDKTRKEAMRGIFNEDQMKLILQKIFRSVYFLNVFTEMAKARSAD